MYNTNLDVLKERNKANVNTKDEFLSFEIRNNNLLQVCVRIRV